MRRRDRARTQTKRGRDDAAPADIKRRKRTSRAGSSTADENNAVPNGVADEAVGGIYIQ